MLRAVRLATLIAASLLSIASASAAVIDITYTGQIFGGTANASDGTPCGLCSPSGYDFTGQPFTLTYVFDTALAAPGGYTHNSTSSQLSGSWNALTGGTFVGSATGLPSISGFNPATCSVAGCSSAEVDAASAGSTYNQSITWNFSGMNGASVSTFLFANPAIPGDITAAFTLSGANIGSGSFSSFASPGTVCGSPATWQCQSGDLRIESISVSQTPLPSALPLFAVGCGVVAGCLGLRRKRQPQLGS